MLTNIRGFNSKKHVFEKISYDIQADILCITETHTSANFVPKFKGFRCFFRNRLKRAKGGLVVMVKENIAKDAVQIWSAADENECLAVMFPSLAPKLVVMCSYGTQVNSFGKSVPETNLREIFGMID